MCIHMYMYTHMHAHTHTLGCLLFAVQESLAEMKILILCVYKESVEINSAPDCLVG